MQHIRLNIHDQYFSTFLDFLKTLNYVEVEGIEIKKKTQKARSPKATKTELFLEGSDISDPLREAVKPIRAHVSLEELIAKQGYKGVDRKRFDGIVAGLDIQESVEELLLQLSQ